MSFIDGIKKKQSDFEARPISTEELSSAVQKVKDYITKLTDDPYNYSVSSITINYVATNDGNGTCKFWVDDDKDNILFELTVPHFRKVLDELSRNDGFRDSGSFGQRDGHAHLRW